MQYYIYNAILRRYPATEVEKYNNFATTIYVLCSAVNKLSRCKQVQADGSLVENGLPLYRGLGSLTDLPDVFSHGMDGRNGYAEWGFLSTTSNKKIALQYSGVREGNQRAMVIKFYVTSIDRGASVQAFSQYPQVTLQVSCLSNKLICSLIFVCFLVPGG